MSQIITKRSSNESHRSAPRESGSRKTNMASSKHGCEGSGELKNLCGGRLRMYNDYSTGRMSVRRTRECRWNGLRYRAGRLLYSGILQRRVISRRNVLVM